MRGFGDVEAVRILLEQEPGIEAKIPAHLPHDSWHAAIVREAQKLCQYVKSITDKAVTIYRNQIWREKNTDGRLVEIRHPVRLSGGVRDSIILLEAAEPKLNQFEKRFEIYRKRATFGKGDEYERLATDALNFQEKIIPRSRLYLHTYLWFLWTQEALNQANQFGGLMMNEYDFEKLSQASFPYIAHPPLIVATIACSTMIEEVGAEWVNAYIDDRSHEPDGTSVNRVLADIKECYSRSDEFELEKIESEIVDTRNEISHYVTRRGDAVTLENFEPFYIAVIEGMELVDALLSDLVLLANQGFEQQLESLY